MSLSKKLDDLADRTSLHTTLHDLADEARDLEESLFRAQILIGMLFLEISIQYEIYITRKDLKPE